jgi:hypothetical protein
MYANKKRRKKSLIPTAQFCFEQQQQQKPTSDPSLSQESKKGSLQISMANGPAIFLPLNHWTPKYL